MRLSLPIAPTPARRPQPAHRIAPRMRQPCNWDTHLTRDLRTLVKFIELYCQDHHGADREPVDVQLPTGKPLRGKIATLCPDCRKLLTHALVKRYHCPHNPKPQCKHCPAHCYAPVYRRQIRAVMKHSGRKLVMRGRLDYLLHLLF